MGRHIVYAMGLVLALTGTGAWAVDQQPADNGAGAGTELQSPAPIAGQTNLPQSSVPGRPGMTTTPTYYSPLQEFASRNFDEVGELSQELTQMKAAKRPDAVMVLYHMIREHRLLTDAAQDILARRGDVAALTITALPIPTTPDAMIQQDIQGHEAAAANLQQMIANASSPEEKRLYQQGLEVTNKHLNWLRSLSQGQQVAMGFFGPTAPLESLIGTTTVASAPGYPQPVVTRTAGFQQRYAGHGSAGAARRAAMRRGIRHRRYRHRRYHRYTRTYVYR